jgi:hypothetical protein
VAEPAPPAPEEALAWVGFRLDEIGGAAAGRIEGALVDARSGRPTWLVVRTGRIGYRVAVPFGLAVAGVGRVWVPYPRDLIRSCAEVDPAAGIGPDQEATLCEHYGIPAPWRARIAGPNGEAPSSVPAVAR